MIKGREVRLNSTGVAAMGRHRYGILINSSVASCGRGGHIKTGCVRVLWNGNKEPVTVARNFLEYADAYGAT